MKWVLIAVAVLLVLVAVVWAIGSSLPKEHLASRTARFRQSPETVWAAITDIEAMPSWRTDLKSIQRLPDQNGRPAWVETMGMGEIPLAVVESVAPRRLVTRITGKDLPFGGTWTFEIEPAEGGATLTITERGEVYPPLFRFMSRYLFGHAATLEQYLKSLGRKFGEEVAPQ